MSTNTPQKISHNRILRYRNYRHAFIMSYNAQPHRPIRNPKSQKESTKQAKNQTKQQFERGVELFCIRKFMEARTQFVSVLKLLSCFDFVPIFPDNSFSPKVPFYTSSLPFFGLKTSPVFPGFFFRNFRKALICSGSRLYVMPDFQIIF